MFIVGAWSVQLPVANDDATSAQDQLLVLVDCGGPTGRPPGDALRHEPGRSCGVRGIYEVPCALGAHAVISGGEVRELLGTIGEIC